MLNKIHVTLYFLGGGSTSFTSDAIADDVFTFTGCTYTSSKVSRIVIYGLDEIDGITPFRDSTLHATLSNGSNTFDCLLGEGNEIDVNTMSYYLDRAINTTAITKVSI